MIGGDAIRQRVRTAGVLRHVAADGAGALAGGIGRVEIAFALDGLRNFEIHDAGLEHRAFVCQVDFDDAVHAGERNDHAAGAGIAPPLNPVPAPRPTMGMWCSGRLTSAALLRWISENDQIRAGFVDAAVVFVERQVFGPVQVPARPDYFFDGC